MRARYYPTTHTFLILTIVFASVHIQSEEISTLKHPLKFRAFHSLPLSQTEQNSRWKESENLQKFIHQPEEERLWRSETKQQRGVVNPLEETDESKNEEETRPLIFSSDGQRMEFQIQGHEGPDTYIFGFDTGHGRGRQFRLEEKGRDGTVKGEYGYYDAKGKLRTIRYSAKPRLGYQEKHHIYNGKI